MRFPLLLRLLLCALPAFALPAAAQEAAPSGLVVMNLAAHPDDEDGQTLAYYRRARNAVAYSVIFTRGEGGQNEIGPELYEELGALRTEETERAARILGTQVYFLNFPDFGFSKFADESFERWGGRDSVTARLVYLIRKLKPDVLFTNHDTVTVGPNRQHGQHQAVGLAAYDAFALAADSSYHPEQLREPGVSLWQPARLFLRHWRQPAGPHLAVPVGVPDASGRSYAQLAMDALREHLSQGMGLFADRARPPHTYFTLLRSATDAPPSADDLAAGLPPNRHAAPDLAYRIDSGRLPGLPDGSVVPDDSIAVPNQQVSVRVDPAVLPAGAVVWRFRGAVDTAVVSSAASPSFRIRVPPGAAPTVPKSVYQYRRLTSRPPVLFTLHRQGEETPFAAGYLPLEIAPPLVLRPVAEVVRLRPGQNSLSVPAHVYDPGVREIALGVALVAHGAPDRVLLQEQFFHPLDGDGEVRLPVPLRTADTLAPGSYGLVLTAAPAGGRAAPVRLHQPARLFEAAAAPGLQVGVVASYDDAMEQALRELGVSYRMLDSLDLAHARFDGLHTIVVDIRAYLVRPDLRAHNPQLLDWVRRGGHLIVNYHKTFEWNPDGDPFLGQSGGAAPTGFAPYPLILGRARVTYEDAPVTLLRPDHPIFNRPNDLTDADWQGWVQERGLYFPDRYDERYEELVAMHDPGEPPLRSAMLLARYGEGTYLYTALGWYRQLKQFHPGAYRTFANMISLPLTR